MRNNGNQWLTYARSLDRVDETKKIPFETRPSPIPPENARLEKLSVTQIKDLVRDPYKIYAFSYFKVKKIRSPWKTS